MCTDKRAGSASGSRACCRTSVRDGHSSDLCVCPQRTGWLHVWTGHDYQSAGRDVRPGCSCQGAVSCKMTFYVDCVCTRTAQFLQWLQTHRCAAGTAGGPLLLRPPPRPCHGGRAACLPEPPPPTPGMPLHDLVLQLMQGRPLPPPAAKRMASWQDDGQGNRVLPDGLSGLVRTGMRLTAYGRDVNVIECRRLSVHSYLSLTSWTFCAESSNLTMLHCLTPDSALGPSTWAGDAPAVRAMPHVTHGWSARQQTAVRGVALHCQKEVASV